LKTLGSEEHNEGQWRVIFHDDFVPEFKLFADAVRREIYARIELLMKFGPQLGRPHVDTLKGSSVPNLKELRFSADDGAWRVAFAFDMKRQAILLVGGPNREFRRTSFIGSSLRLPSADSINTNEVWRKGRGRNDRFV